MRGKQRFFAVAALAAGLTMVPAIGSQGAGALGQLRPQGDSHLFTSAQSPIVLDIANALAERRVAEIVLG